MHVRLVFLGRLQDRAGSGELTFEAKPGDTVSALLDLLDPFLADELRSPKVRIAVGGAMGGLDAAVSDGDEVAFLPPVSGG